jgi:hypothetical protein
MIELLLPCEFDTLEYSWVNATIDICTLADYSMAKKHQHLTLFATCGCRDVPHAGATCLDVVAIGRGHGPLKALLAPLFVAFGTLLGAAGGGV